MTKDCRAMYVRGDPRILTPNHRQPPRLEPAEPALSALSLVDGPDQDSGLASSIELTLWHMAFAPSVSNGARRMPVGTSETIPSKVESKLLSGFQHRLNSLYICRLRSDKALLSVVEMQTHAALARLASGGVFQNLAG